MKIYLVFSGMFYDTLESAWEDEESAKAEKEALNRHFADEEHAEVFEVEVKTKDDLAATLKKIKNRKR